MITIKTDLAGCQLSFKLINALLQFVKNGLHVILCGAVYGIHPGELVGQTLFRLRLGPSLLLKRQSTFLKKMESGKHTTW